MYIMTRTRSTHPKYCIKKELFPHARLPHASRLSTGMSEQFVHGCRSPQEEDGLRRVVGSFSIPDPLLFLVKSTSQVIRDKDKTLLSSAAGTYHVSQVVHAQLVGVQPQGVLQIMQRHQSQVPLPCRTPVPFLFLKSNAAS